MAAPGIVIVGAGEAGGRAALTLRKNGFAGDITLIGEEVHPPYERPPLSKAVMVAEGEPPHAIIATHDFLVERGIAFLHSSRAVQVDRESRNVVLGNGRAVPYAKLLLATGARPRRLAIEGGEDALYLRTFADALALRAWLRPGARLVVIGGGFIGLEITASAVARGCHVTLLEAAPRILMRGVPAQIAEFVAARHRAAGVALRLGVGIARIARRPDGLAVFLVDGSEFCGDAVIIGVGAVPETTLAEACGLAIDNGIAVDATLHTSDASILAAGDCCSFPVSIYDGMRVRLEAWRNAQDQGALAGRNMAGDVATYDAVPWFWSDQYEQTLQVAGLPHAGPVTVQRTTGDNALLFFHLAEDGRLMAASGVGPPAIGRDIRLAERLIQKRARPAAGDLASADVRLKSLLAA
jgi:3-phenylpropionate/trans-cinnamate dioxygenase ferredoxin reductase subunit